MSEEKLDRLQERIAELQDPDFSSKKITKLNSLLKMPKLSPAMAVAILNKRNLLKTNPSYITSKISELTDKKNKLEIDLQKKADLKSKKPAIKVK